MTAISINLTLNMEGKKYLTKIPKDFAFAYFDGSTNYLQPTVEKLISMDQLSLIIPNHP